MDKETARLILILIPKLPLIFRVCLLHLHLSTPAKYLDLRTAVTVSVLRSLIAPSRPPSISQTQRLTLRDPGIKGRIWVSKYTAPAPPETDVRDVLLSVVDRMRPRGGSDPDAGYRPGRGGMGTGYRAAAESSHPSVDFRKGEI